LAFPEALEKATLRCVRQASLQMGDLDISLCVLIWRWFLLCLLNKTINWMSGLLVPSRLWELCKLFAYRVRSLTHITQQLCGTQLMRYPDFKTVGT
jgi:hypothetical protein